MKLLLIEDDPEISRFLISGLSKEGYKVDPYVNGEDGITAAKSEVYDISIVDLMLPGIDGLTVIKELRGSNLNFPVLILSAKKSVDERVHGLKSGGDDYLTKPFSFEELLARLHSLLRRSNGANGVEREKMLLSYNDITLDRITRKVTRMGKQIELQPREFLLLELMLSNPGRVFTKNILLEKIWEYYFDPQTNIVDVLVCRLRSKIDTPFEAKLIHTVRGIGYVLGEHTRQLLDNEDA